MMFLGICPKTCVHGREALRYIKGGLLSMKKILALVLVAMLVLAGAALAEG